MLVQQAGPGALPLSNLAPQDLLPFFRRIEESVIYHSISPVLVYWSSRRNAWMLPPEPQLRNLQRDAVCVSVFLEETLDTQDEFCFLVHSQGISAVIYGHCSDESGAEKVYKCLGSIDPHIVERAYKNMIQLWQSVDLSQAVRLDDARNQVGNAVTAPHFVSGIRHDWPVIKHRGQSPAPPAPEAGNSSFMHPQMVVVPGAEVPLSPAAVALDASAAGPVSKNIPPPPPGPVPGSSGMGGIKTTGQFPQSGLRTAQALSSSQLMGPAASQSVAASGQAQAAPEIRAAASSAERGAPGNGRSKLRPQPSKLPGFEEEYEADIGDPSLLQEEFNFEGLTDSPLFKPPAADETQSKKPESKNPTKKKDHDRLREVWTNITQEQRTVFPPDAQRIIRDIVSQLRISSDLPAILDLAIEELTKLSHSHRGLIWQVVDDQLVVTNEFAQNGHYCFKQEKLGSQETTAIVSEFLSRFPDDAGDGVIAISDVLQDTNLRRMSPTLAALIELGDVRARLVAQVRSRGIFHGFIELQQSQSTREWSEQDGAVLQSVSETLSLVIQQSFDLLRIERDAQEMKLVNEISSIFRESGGQRAQYSIEQAIHLFAEHTGFIHAQVYLYSEEEGVLVPQILDKEHAENIPLVHKHNPFLQAFDSGKLKTVNTEFSKRADPFFQHDTAMIIPLMSEGEKLGVLGLWKRHEGSSMLRPQDREIALTVAGNLASIIRVEQANAQTRQHSARATLINTVSEQIQQSIKDVNPILQTLVSQLASHLGLGLAAVSVWDILQETFMAPKCSGIFLEKEDSLLDHAAESIFRTQYENLGNPELLAQPMPAIVMNSEDLRAAAGEFAQNIPGQAKLGMVFPLRQGSIMKGALCMLLTQEKMPSLADMCMIQDLLNRIAVVIEHKELFEKVERQAITDPLTGLFNRRYFEEQLNKELDRHQRFGHSCSFIILDLDHFKSVNDTLDHMNGDIALKHTSAIVKRCVRDVDTVGRFGGEEFVVLLPESDENAAAVVAERICSSIRDSVIEAFRSEECHEKIDAKFEEGKINEATAERLRNGKITASVGVSTFPKDAQDKTKLVELADKYLFLAKSRGRNQVCSSKHDTGEAALEKPEKAAPVKAQAAKPVAAQTPVNPQQVSAPAHSAPSPGQAAAGIPTFRPVLDRRGRVADSDSGPPQAPPMPEPPSVIQSVQAGSRVSDVQLIAEHGIVGLLENIVRNVSSKDGYSDDRSQRASELATRVAQLLRLSNEHTTIVSLAAVLNNIGKLLVDEEILLKSGPLSPAEKEAVQSAPSAAARMLEPARHLHRVASVVESYHEHWDGSGYPKGLRGEEIPLESRIIAVVDAYVAMTSDRPYRAAMSKQEAMQALQKGAGKEWDPRLVKAFLAILQREKEI